MIILCLHVYLSKVCITSTAPDCLDEIPVKQESSIKPVETSQPGPWTLSALMEQYSVIHDNGGSKSDESMSRKSTMSISRIANMLENMTCTSPRDLFDKVMKQGKL